MQGGVGAEREFVSRLSGDKQTGTDSGDTGSSLSQSICPPSGRFVYCNLFDRCVYLLPNLPEEKHLWFRHCFVVDIDRSILRVVIDIEFSFCSGQSNSVRWSVVVGTMSPIAYSISQSI